MPHGTVPETTASGGSQSPPPRPSGSRSSSARCSAIPAPGSIPWLVGFHIAGAVLVAAVVAAFLLRVWDEFRQSRVLYRGAWVLAGLVDVQLILGLTAYFVTLDDAGMLQPSNLQVVVNTAHAVIGALVMAGSVLAVLATHRWGRRPTPAG